MRLQSLGNAIFGALCACILLVSPMASALDHNDGESPYQDISATAIQMEFPSKTILGQDYMYPTGVPFIEAFMIEIPAGKQTSLHKHAVPMYVYVTSGELEVDYGSKGKRAFPGGSSYVEAINWCHFGKAVGNQTVKLIGVYLGQREPNQINPESCAKLE